MESSRRASLINEEAQQMRARELAIGASSSKLEDVEKSTTEGAYIFVGTTDGGPTTEGVVSWKLDPPSC